jgi:hypothetical protein
MQNNLLDKTKSYLIGYMEYGDGSKWREMVAKELSPLGVTCFDPYKKPFESQIKEDPETQAYLKSQRESNLKEVHDHMKEVIAFDLAMVDRSDFIICVINPKIPTYGTTHEIVVANQAKKPIFVAIEGGIKEAPLWLTGLLKPSYFYNSVEEIIEKLKKINSNEIKVDSDRWRFFRSEFR